MTRPEVVLTVNEAEEITNIATNNMTDQERADVALSIIEHIINQPKIYPPIMVQYIKQTIIDTIKEM